MIAYDISFSTLLRSAGLSPAFTFPCAMRICAFPPLALALAFFFSLSLLAVLVAGSKFCRFFGAGLCSMNNNQQPAAPKSSLVPAFKLSSQAARCTQATIGDFPSKPSHAAQSRSISPQSRQPLQPRERDSFWHLQLPATSSRSSRLRTPKLVALSECSRVLEAQCSAGAETGSSTVRRRGVGEKKPSY